MKQTFNVASLEETEKAGKQISALLSIPSCVYLNGEMGAGKTTLAKSIIHGLGYVGDVTSPTYNLIQEYPVSQGIIYHMDLYRVEDPSELEYLALDDLWGENSLFLVEWPQLGSGYLRKPDYELLINKEVNGSSFFREITVSKRNDN